MVYSNFNNIKQFENIIYYIEIYYYNIDSVDGE